jgi:hypothetical protein
MPRRDTSEQGEESLAERLDALQATNASMFGDINASLQRLDANMLANDNHLFTTQAHQQATDKNLAIFKRDINKRFDGLEESHARLNARMGDSHARLEARMGDSHAMLNERIEDSHARLKASMVASIGDVCATLNERIEDSSARLNARIGAMMKESRAEQGTLSTRLEQFISSFDNSAR